MDKNNTQNNTQYNTPYPLKTLKSRVLFDKFFHFLCLIAGLIVIIFLISILSTLVIKGLPNFKLSLLTQVTPAPGESTGGLENAILGSIIISGIGIIIATIIGVASATYLAEFCTSKKIIQRVNYLNDMLLSAPSIIIGLFAYAILVKPLGGFNAIAGIISLAIIALPMIHRTVYDAMTLVSHSLRESAVSLGMSRATTTFYIIFKTAKASILTAILLSFARILGETAPLLFTSLNNSFLSFNMLKPMSSLPVVIYQFSMSPDKYWQSLAWSGALLITVVILVLNLIAKSKSNQGK